MSIAREMRALGIAGSWLNVTEDGKVTPATRQCLEIIAKHDMVLATSHIRPSEVLPVVKAAQEVGVKRIVITHPEFPTTLLSIAAAAGAGAAGRVLRALLHHAQHRQDQLGAGVRQHPRGRPESTILATDLGQTTAPVPRRRAWACSSASCSTTASPKRRCAHGARQPGPAARARTTTAAAAGVTRRR